MIKITQFIKSVFQTEKVNDQQAKAYNIEALDKMPRHVAVIMDGNGRWAKQRGLPRIAGHNAGMQTVKRITKFSNNIGIKILTLYAFSTENWKRPSGEVSFLMKLPEEYLKTELKELIDNNVQVRVIGDIEKLPEHTKKAVEQAVRDTLDNTGMILNFALNYGSRQEIIQMVKTVADEVQHSAVKVTDIDEQYISKKLMTHSLLDPDLLIRTSGELRLSNFLLWQLAYTELYFTETLWPDFSEAEFSLAINNYTKRARRYGGLTEEAKT